MDLPTGRLEQPLWDEEGRETVAEQIARLAQVVPEGVWRVKP